MAERRERDRAEREAADRDRRVQQLEQELQAERGRNDRLSVRGGVGIGPYVDDTEGPAGNRCKHDLCVREETI